MTDQKRRQGIGWEDFHTYCWQISNLLKETIPNIVGSKVITLIPVARGGLIPSVLLSHMLELNVGAPIVCQSYYEGQQGDEVRLHDPIPLHRTVPNSIFVDDIIDTGNTIEKILSVYPNAMFVAPVGKPVGVNKVQKNLIVHPPKIVFDDIWVDFPWEGVGHRHAKTA